MTKITVSPDCGNAPRKQFLKDFNIAFATGDADFIIQHVCDDIEWNIHGDKHISGKEAFTKEIYIMKEYSADEVVIHTIITHGREAALNGEMKIEGKTGSVKQTLSGLFSVRQNYCFFLNATL
ncbi:MAG: hypothetical protein HC819_16635, partial [Cyclobacteriaceae bacterium]|nr:hypothetical protein [Cyclobacteriaceae bacterium]